MDPNVVLLGPFDPSWTHAYLADHPVAVWFATTAYCRTERGAAVCTCGRYRLRWEEPANAAHPVAS